MCTFQDFLRWEDSSRDVVLLNKNYIDMCGDVLTGIMLSEIVYWHLPSKTGRTKLRVIHDNKLWLAVRREDWYDRIRLTPDQADRCILILVKLGIIIKEIYKFDGNPTTHLRINEQVFIQKWEETLKAKTFSPVRDQLSRVGDNDMLLEARTLTEHTTETTTPIAGGVFSLLDSENQKPCLTEENTIDGIPADKWFDELAGKNQRVIYGDGDYREPPPSNLERSKTHADGVINAIGRFQESQVLPGIKRDFEDYILSLPECLHSLARAFVYGVDRKPTSREEKRWLADFKYLNSSGIVPREISPAIKYMRDMGLMIKSPQSIYTIMVNQREQRKKSQESPPATQEFISEAGRRALEQAKIVF